MFKTKSGLIGSPFGLTLFNFQWVYCICVGGLRGRHLFNGKRLPAGDDDIVYFIVQGRKIYKCTYLTEVLNTFVRDTIIKLNLLRQGKQLSSDLKVENVYDVVIITEN